MCVYMCGYVSRSLSHAYVRRSTAGGILGQRYATFFLTYETTNPPTDPHASRRLAGRREVVEVVEVVELDADSRSC
jgi:hypothetical protein